jgi:hypothetical protein
MNDQKFPPFSVNQKVVALKTSLPTLGVQVVKGNIYTVVACERCVCGNWLLLLRELPINISDFGLLCCMPNTSPYAGGNSKYFAPIEPMYEDIRKELAVLPINETSDVKIKILEPQN